MPGMKGQGADVSESEHFDDPGSVSSSAAFKRHIRSAFRPKRLCEKCKGGLERLMERGPPSPQRLEPRITPGNSRLGKSAMLGLERAWVSSGLCGLGGPRSRRDTSSRSREGGAKHFELG